MRHRWTDNHLVTPLPDGTGVFLFPNKLFFDKHRISIGHTDSAAGNECEHFVNTLREGRIFALLAAYTVRGFLRSTPVRQEHGVQNDELFTPYRRTTQGVQNALKFTPNRGVFATNVNIL